jgi:hypothetical protein
VNECVPIFSAGMRPLATIFSRVGMDTQSRRALVTSAAIKLEDYVEGLCSHIDPANPRADKRQVGTKIRGAQRVLAARTTLHDP